MDEITWKIITWIMIVLMHNVDSFTHVDRPSRLVSLRLPDKRPLKKALGFIEDTYLNFTELTDKYGYPTEVHSVTTEDGYILTVFRILSKCNGVTKGYPVVLMHGINDSADNWITTGPERSLAYILSRKCFDVWAANNRGNVYSRRHVRLNPNTDPEFWEFTFEEHGLYDIPAIVDHIISVTQRPKVNYIGHSQGTTDFLTMGSLKPEYNEKFELSFLLAPVAWMAHIKSLIPKLIAPAHVQIRKLLYDLGFRELFARNSIVQFIVEFLCQYAPEEVCGTGLALTTGYKRGNITPRDLSVTIAHLFSGLATKDLAHFGQLISTGRFQRFDNGMVDNLKIYGTVIPPEYNVSRITSNIVLINAKSDWLSDLEDVDTLRSKLPNVVENYVVPDPTWSHNDHLYGIKAPEYVYSKILQYLDNISS